jgi:hypothetical protein
MRDEDRSLNEANTGTSQIFAYTALALYGAFLFGLAEVLVPNRSFDTYWLLGTIQTLINQSLLPLLGACLLLIGARRHPESDLLWAWLHRTRRWALPVSLLLLLLLPVQLVASASNVIAGEAAANRDLAALRSAEQEMRLNGLRQRPSMNLGALVSPPASDRGAVIESLRTAIAQRESKQRERIQARLPRLILGFLHVALQSILLALAYAAVAMRDPLRGNLLQQLQASWLRARDDVLSQTRNLEEAKEDMRYVREHRRARELALQAQQASQQRDLAAERDDDPLDFDDDFDDGFEDDEGDEGVWSRGARLQRSATLPEGWDLEEPAAPPASPADRGLPPRP